MTRRELNAQRRNEKKKLLRAMEDYLMQRTVWGKYFARPAQIRAGAKKKLDVMAKQARELAKSLALKTPVTA